MAVRPHEAGQAFLLQPNGLSALARLGVEDRVRARAAEVSHVVFHERGDGRGPVYDYRELRHPQAYALEIRPEALRQALSERATELGVAPPTLGTEVVDVVRRDGCAAGVRCNDGSELDADLVVAADGRSSRTREALGIRARYVGRPSQYVLGTVDVPRDTRDLHVYCGRGYANGVCPLPDGTYFWDCVSPENELAVGAADLEAWRTTYARRVPCADEFVGAVDDWEQLTQVEVRPFWAASRTVPGALLVGDAAGTVHPHSAQGANLALEDAGHLAGALAADPAACRELLDAYGRTRQRKLRRYVLWSLAAGESLDGRTRLWRAVRRQNFLSSRIGPLRRTILRVQAGLA